MAITLPKLDFSNTVNPNANNQQSAGNRPQFQKLPSTYDFAAYLSQVKPPMNMGTNNVPQMPNMNAGANNNANKPTTLPAFPNMPNMGNMPQMPNMGGMGNMGNLFGPPQMNIDQFGNKFGFDYSRDYADKQAQAIQNAKQNAYDDQLRRIESGVNSSVNNLDRDYFQQGLQQRQSQVNSGLNAGIAADQDLRMSMNRQNAMSDIYRDANNDSARIRDDIGRLEAERLAYADELYNTRRQEGYDNLLRENQFQSANAATWADYFRNVTNDNRSFALQEGEMMGNYIPYEARNLVQTILNSKDQLSKTANPIEQQRLLNQSNQARIKLAAMGVNVDQVDKASTFDDALKAISGMNKTMAGTAADYANAGTVADFTGVFTDPQRQSLYNQLLQIKSNVERRGGATQAEVNKMNQLRSELASMGVASNLLAGNQQSWSNAQNNATKLGVQTLENKRQQADIANEQKTLAQQLLEIQNNFKLGDYANQTDRLLGKEQNANNRLEIGYNYEIGKGQNQNDANKIGYDYQLGLQANANDANQIANEYNLGQQQVALDRELGYLDYSLGQAELDYKKAQGLVDAQKVAWDQADANTKKQNATNTNAMIAELGAKSKSEAIAYLGKNAEALVNQGIDVVKVYNTLGLKTEIDKAKKEKGSGSSTSNPIDLGK